MKKITMFMMTALIVVVLAACGATKDDNDNNTDTNRDTENGGVNTTETEMETETDTDTDMGGDDTSANGDEEGNLDLADDAADKVAELDEIDNATVILSENEAYVAVMLADQSENANDVDEEDLSSDLKDQITDKVKEVKTDVSNVYISSNPDFGERMSDFGKRINEGEPVSGFFKEFGEAVRNVFPDAN